MVLRHAEHLLHVLARLGHHDAERGKQYREVGARPVYLQVLQRRSCFPIAPRGVQTTSCTSSPRLTMWSPSGNCRSSTNIWATYARFALLTAAVLARLTISLLALPFGVGQAYRIESIRFQLLCRWASLSLFSCCCTAQINGHHCS